MSEGEPDALIIGGGPAGTAAALALSALGYRSCLIEKRNFPRFRIGESLPPKLQPLLELLGVNTHVEGAGFVRMAGTTTKRGRSPERHLFSPSGLSLGYQVERASFDALLLDECRRRGVEVRHERVERLIFEGERVSGVVSSEPSSGRSSSLRAGMVLDASGSQRVIARRLALTRRSAEKTVALYARWSDPKAPVGFPAEDTLFEMLEDGWVWSVLLPDGTRSVTVGVDVSRLRDRRARDVYLDAVHRAQLLTGVLDSARMLGTPKAHDATWYDARCYAGSGFLLLGDAGFFADPLTSQGVYKAVQGGLVAASVIHTMVTDPRRTELATTYYDQSQQRFALEYAELARSFYERSGYDHAPFWRKRAQVGAELAALDARLPREERERRRREFTEQLRSKGGDRLFVRASSELTVEARPVTAQGKIRERPCFVDRRRPAALGVIDGVPGLDPEILISIFDGRSVSSCFEAYAARSGRAVSSETARQLMEMMGRLAEEGLIELVQSV